MKLFQNDELSENNLDEFEDYETVLSELKSKWLLAEIDHSVSKCASEAFWKIGLQFFHRLHLASGRKKTCLFNSIRRQMYKDKVPDINIEIGYKDKTSGEVVVVNETVTPIKRFPQSKYEKLYEIGTIQVSTSRLVPN